MVHCIVCGEETDNLQAHLAASHADEPPEKIMQAFAQMMPQQMDTMSKSPNYCKYYAFDTHLDMTHFDFRISAINELTQSQETPLSAPVVNRLLDATFILTPVAAKNLHIALGDAIAHFEAQLGPITPPNPQS